MIEFFRDVLDGPLYIIILILSVIFIMAIIGFLMERKKLEKIEKDKLAVVSNENVVSPIQPVFIEKVQTISNAAENVQAPASNLVDMQPVSSNEVKPPLVVLENMEQIKE